MKFIPILILALFSNFAHSSCTLKRTDGVMVDSLTVTLPKFDPPPFDPNVNDGAVIFSSSGTSSGLGGHLQCNSPIGVVKYEVTTGSAPGKYSTYPTSVAGVGVRVKGAVSEGENDWWPQSINYGSWLTQNDFVAASTLTIELVKTGPITAQGVLSGEIAKTYSEKHDFKIRSIVTNGAINIRPKVPTCAVETKQIDVKMSPTGSNFTSRDFGGVGGTTPERDFSIQLKCSGGNPGTSTNAYVTLTDNSKASNRSKLLSLTPDSKASGVAVQILRNGTPLGFGPDSSDASNPNQWKAGSIPQGQGVFTIPLTARYIQTGTLKGGTANAVATFTMSYQ
ncbi:fimbrial protein [Burkholderia pyrrocinia]|uniref:fimbrial protein n=1 Tax=Burkholderia pyrrocinia TaxID=60550 RepID=UPI00158C7C8F|nr:fimbrial protein [Burkholderia pyrrocinia]